MDLSAFKKSDWLKVGGAAGFFIFGFFSWVTVEIAGFSAVSKNVFGFFWTGTLPWLLIMATAVVTVLLALKVLKADQLPWPLIMLAASGLAALLLLIRLLFNPISGADEAESILGGAVDIGRDVGMFLSVISGLVVLAGAFLGFTESGGNLNDLKDVDKLKGQFGMSSSPSASAPPPPPPPPPPAAPPAPPAPPTAPPPPPPAP